MYRHLRVGDGQVGMCEREQFAESAVTCKSVGAVPTSDTIKYVTLCKVIN